MEVPILNHLSFALGAASFGGCNCIGESIILNHIGYTTYVNSQQNLVTESGFKDLRSPFLMGVSDGCSSSHLLSLNFQEGLDLYQLFHRVKLPAFAFMGGLLFKTLSCTYLKKPPIFNETIIGKNTEKYWAKAEEYTHRYAYVFGVVIKEEGKSRFPQDKLKKAFYINPQEKNQDGLLSHTHAALINVPLSFSSFKQKEQLLEALDPSIITEVRHIFTQSIVQEGVLLLFDLKGIG